MEYQLKYRVDIKHHFLVPLRFRIKWPAMCVCCGKPARANQEKSFEVKIEKLVSANLYGTTKRIFRRKYSFMIPSIGIDDGSCLVTSS